VIFADTSFWVALRNRRDPHHTLAAELLRSHGDRGIVTSNHIRGETWTYLRRRAGHGAAVGFLDSLERTPRVRLVAASAKQEEDALRFLRQRDEREYSFVDATSFVIMKNLRVREALAFDGDFSAAGFIELRE
jgi:predicted nucleic acid-binding protein